MKSNDSLYFDESDYEAKENIAVEILPIGPFNQNFFYLSDEKVTYGDIVKIPFGNRQILGLVVGTNKSTDIKLKSISQKTDISLNDIYINFLEWVASYTLIPRGNVLKMILCEKSIFKDEKKSKRNVKDRSIAVTSSCHPIQLNSEQQKVYETIKKNNADKPFLLQGVTGSGKTEVYLSLIKDILQKEEQALILLPEIALTSQLSARIEKYFGITPLIWNSNITPKNRRQIWLKAISGEKSIIIGTRSALFIPFKKLGIIVVDEEHDSSYKQEEGAIYNARDMAIVLANLNKIPIILTSATPSLESYINAQNNKYAYAFIKNKFGIAKSSTVELIDMRQSRFKNDFISSNLLESIKSNIQKKEQTLIYLNRRGYAPLTICKSCGQKMACPNCSAWLVFHKKTNKIVCHYCGHSMDIPKKCNICGTENSFIQFGPGIERVFEEISNKIPSARILMVSSDNVSSEKNILEIREKILNNEVDIIIGTQILAKGHHFPNITLVGIIDGDIGLNCADIRSAEKTYQLIQQVAGRAGRAEKPGKILIQTFTPEHSLYSALKSDDPKKFIDLEIFSRKENDLPPFSRFASLIISGTNSKLTEQTAKILAESFPKTGVTLFGPAPAPLLHLRGRTRWRILCKSAKKIALNKVIKDWISSQKTPKNIKIQIDIDPVTFL